MGSAPPSMKHQKQRILTAQSLPRSPDITELALSGEDKFVAPLTQATAPEPEAKQMRKEPSPQERYEQLRLLLPQAERVFGELKMHGDAFYTLVALLDGDSAPIDGVPAHIVNLISSVTSNDEVRQHIVSTTAKKMIEAWGRLSELAVEAVAHGGFLERLSQALDNEVELKNLEGQ